MRTEADYIERKGFGRRATDGTCPLHNLVHDDNEKDHTHMCGKIAKVDSKMDHKVDKSDFYWLIGVVIVVISTVVGATNLWLRSDIKDGLTVIDRRVTENAEERKQDIKAITSELKSISSDQQVIKHRVGEIESKVK